MGIPVVRRLSTKDRERWLRLRETLWPDLLSDPQAGSQAAAWLKREDAAVFVVVDGDVVHGFVEVGERPYADGCETSPVAFLEGWFVAEPLRRHGLGNALLRAAEDWACARGLTEIASDSLLEDRDAQLAHRAVGFEEVERAVRYRKALGSAGGVPRA